MAKEDLLLREEMGRLEIDPMKVKENKNENPFNVQAKRMHVIHCVHTVACACTHHKKYKNAGICKKKSNKLLKEPVLQVLKSCISRSNQDNESQPKCSSTLDGNTDSLNLCTLVTTCNQLKISNDSKEKIVPSTSNNENKWWSKSKSTSHVRENRELRQHSQTGSCSQQALNPPCDVTIDELASYFETLVHIPKKMSSMAEMMYI